MERYQNKRERFLVANKLKGRVLKVEESQQVGFGKSGVNNVESSDWGDKGWGERQIRERQQLTQSPILFEIKVC